MANMQCRNCDEMGHVSKECPKPRDCESLFCRYQDNGHLRADDDLGSRVTCSNCGESGHTKVKCRAPPKEDTGFDEPSAADTPMGRFDDPEPVAADDAWTSTAATTVW